MSAERNRLINELDRLHSLVVRKMAGARRERIPCYTCNGLVWFENATCGHLWSRNNKSIRWDFDNTRFQCRVCQSTDNGMRKEFEKRLRFEIGDERVDALAARKRSITQWTVDELKELLAERKEQLRNL